MLSLRVRTSAWLAATALLVGLAGCHGHTNQNANDAATPGSDAAVDAMPGCTTSSSCPNGQVCLAGQCSPCASDADCASIGSGFVCDLQGAGGTPGLCVANHCDMASGPCPFNTGDFCCGGACVPGNCCTGDAMFGNAYCVMQGSDNTERCENDVCTPCAPVTDGQYAVDPINGSDGSGNGNGGQPGCAFKTLRRALQVLGNQASPVTVTVLSDVPTSNSDSGGIVGNNVTVTAASPTTVYNVGGPGGLALFVAGTNSRVTGITIDGHGMMDGIRVSLSPGSNTTTIDGVTVRNYAHFGMWLTQGTLTIGAGTTIENGSTHPSSGVLVDGGTLHVANAAGTPIIITGNDYGLQLRAGDASITGNAAMATVQIVKNGLDGIAILGPADPSGFVFDGIVANQNGASADPKDGAGLLVAANSFGVIKLRHSTLVGNEISGVRISTSATGMIDLGSGTDWGGNTLQDSLLLNLHAGLCIDVPLQAGVTVAARGNIFSGGRDCSGSLPGTVSKSVVTRCDQAGANGTTDIGWVTAGSLDLANCQ